VSTRNLAAPERRAGAALWRWCRRSRPATARPPPPSRSAPAAADADRRRTVTVELDERACSTVTLARPRCRTPSTRSVPRRREPSASGPTSPSRARAGLRGHCHHFLHQGLDSHLPPRWPATTAPPPGRGHLLAARAARRRVLPAAHRGGRPGRLRSAAARAGPALRLSAWSTEDATFSLMESLSVSPRPGRLHRLQRYVGLARTKEFLDFGDPLDGAPPPWRSGARSTRWSPPTVSTTRAALGAALRGQRRCPTPPPPPPLPPPPARPKEPPPPAPAPTTPPPRGGRRQGAVQRDPTGADGRPCLHEAITPTSTTCACASKDFREGLPRPGAPPSRFNRE